MAKAFAVASGAGDVQAFTGSGVLVGYSVRESAGSPAAAALILRDGTDTSGSIKATIALPASGSSGAMLPAVEFTTGVFVDRLSGTSELVIYIQ